MQDPADPLHETIAVIARLINQMSEAVLVITREHQVVALNRAAVDLLGLKEREAGLRSIDEYDALISSWRAGDEQSDAPSELARALAGQELRDQRVTITTAAGEERRVSFSTTPVFDGDDVRFAVLSMQDRTENERDRRYWQAVATAATGLTSRLAVEEVLQSAVDVTVEALGGEVVLGIWRLDDDTQRLHLRAHRGISEESADRLAVLPLDTPSLICEAAQEREVRYEEDLQRTPAKHAFDRELARRESLGSWITGPLVANGTLVGTMGYGLRRANRLFTHELSAVGGIGSLFAIAIVHAELFEQAEQRREELEAEQESSSRFTGAIAHDLRQPLTLIRGNLGLLARAGDLNEEHLRLIEEVRAATGRLTRMARDLTDTAQMRAGEFAVHPEWTDLPDLVRRAATAVERDSPGHRIRIAESLEALEGEWDHDRLVQVLENLFTNAVKFTPVGGEIAVSIRRGDDEVEVQVRDPGVGIAPDDLPRLFAPFRRLDPSRAVSGTGLGLYIARSIVEAHGGRVWAESEGPGRGATFSFALPITRA